MSVSMVNVDEIALARSACLSLDRVQGAISLDVRANLHEGAFITSVSLAPDPR